jgi:hypothetical protein
MVSMERFLTYGTRAIGKQNTLVGRIEPEPEPETGQDEM